MKRSTEQESEEEEHASPKRRKLQTGFHDGASLTDSSEDDFSSSGLGSVGSAQSPPGFGNSSAVPSSSGFGSPPEIMHSPTSFRKPSHSGGAADDGTTYSAISQKLMKSMGFDKNKGLGKHGQGRVDIVEASMQKGRRGLGHSVKGFEKSNVDWAFEKEEVRIEEHVEWIPTCTQPIPSLEEMLPWIQEGKKKRTLDGENQFISQKTLDDVINCKSVFDDLEGEEMRRARTRSNPYETIRGAFFLNRAAMKMANMDAVTGFMFTNPQNDRGHSLVQPNELLYFADVCAGPGGFSEYVLWRKKCEAKGFGFTLRGPCDFKLEDFFAASSEFFEPHYGKDGDGDIYKADNLKLFRQFVWDNTDGQGLHFVMADGGFSVEGQENIQEILSKRLYLCQFLCALSVLRVGGHFVCKLFDIFTPFSVGLIYLMYRAFTRVSIFKPVTSRPANSERYIICQSLRADSHAIHDYMFEINLRMDNTFSSSLSDMDINEVVPLDILTQDEDFFKYIYDSNESMGKMQAVALVKIQTFAQNGTLYETRQSDTRDQCLKLWEIPDQVRAAPERAEPLGKYKSLTENCVLDLNSGPTILDNSTLKAIHGVYDYRCIVTGSEDRWLLLGLGKLSVFMWNGKPNSRWVKVDKKVELPRDTLIEVEFVDELRGEGKGQHRVPAVHVIDGLVLNGVNIQSLHYKERLQKLQKFIKAINRPTRSDLAPIRLKEVYKLEEASRIFDRLEMKLLKTSRNRLKVCYMCGKHLPNNSRQSDDEQSTPFGSWTYTPHVEQPHFIAPKGLLLIKTTKEPWMVAFSRSRKQWYWYQTMTHESQFHPPMDCIGDYTYTLKKRLLWKWEEGVKLCEQQTHQDEQKISQQSFLDHILKLMPPR